MSTLEAKNTPVSSEYVPNKEVQALLKETEELLSVVERLGLAPSEADILSLLEAHHVAIPLSTNDHVWDRLCKLVTFSAQIIHPYGLLGKAAEEMFGQIPMDLSPEDRGKEVEKRNRFEDNYFRPLKSRFIIVQRIIDTRRRRKT